MRTLLLMLALVSAGWAEDVKVHLRTKVKPSEVDGELLGRSEDKDRMVRVRLGEHSEIAFLPKDLIVIEFPLETNKCTSAEKLYRERNFDQATKTLKELAAPSLSYLDVSNNALPFVRMWLKSSYYDGQYADTVEIAKAIAGSNPVGELKIESQLMRVAGLVGLRQSDPAAALFKKIPMPAFTNEFSGPYLYAQGSLQISQNQWPEAQETIAKLVVYCAKDFEWMPAGLYLSAQGYAHQKQYDVATQIIAEINTMYPDSQWAKQAATLDAELTERRRQETTP